MSDSRVFWLTNVTAWATGFCAVLGFIWSILSLPWITFDPQIGSFVAQWMYATTENIIDCAFWGLFFFGASNWIGCRNLNDEPVVETELVTDHPWRFQLYILGFILIALVTIAGLYGWGIVTETYINNSSMPGYVAMLIFSSGGIVFFGRHFLHELCQARYVLLEKDKCYVYFIHLGNRKFDLVDSFKQTKIEHGMLILNEFNRPMMRVWFGGLRFAVLPLDWEIPLPPVETQPAM